MNKFRLILASASPRRRKLLKEAGFPFQVKVSRVVEPSPRGKVSPRKWVVKLAKLKALEVAGRVKEGLVLGADTVVFQKGKIFGKPRSVSHAKVMLKALGDAWHTVHTGVVLVSRPSGRIWTAAAATRVKMRPFTEAELNRWAARNHDKAGGYAAQEKKDPFVRKLRGDYDNVVGLPLKTVRKLLKKAGA